MMTKIFAIIFVLCVCTCQAYGYVNCTETGAGRHGDLSDTTCKNYSLCIYVKATNSFISYDTVCPSTTVFDPRISRCTSNKNYECKPPATKSACESEGFIPDPYVKNCSSYIQCIEINGTFTEWRFNCPKNTYYNPKTTFCELDYKCITSSFNCTAAGRVADENDYTCKRYYYCVELANGLFAQYNYTCPSTSLFNPITKLCTSKYQCD